MEHLPENPVKLRALLPKVISVVRSRRASLLADLEGLGCRAPTTADWPEPSKVELEREENPAALQQLIRQAQSRWHQVRAELEAANAGAREFARAGQYYYPRFLEKQEADAPMECL